MFHFAFIRRRLSAVAALILTSGLAGACTTMEMIQAESPNHVIAYEGVARAALVDCAHAKIEAMGGQRLIVRRKGEVTVIETYVRELTPVPGVGYMRSNLPRVATHFFDDRVEIYAREEMVGGDGAATIPIINSCVAALGA